MSAQAGRHRSPTADAPFVVGGPAAASTRATRSGRSPATSPSPGPRAPARPCTWAERAAASSGATPRATSAPMTPLSTSPVPAVARAGVPDRPSRTRPNRSATAVVAPFSSATVPLADANRRAAAMRSGPGRSPVSCPYSPSWGVRTTTERACRESSPPTLPSANRPSASTRTGTGDSATSRRTSAAVSGARPMPGPTTTDGAPRRPASRASVGPPLPPAAARSPPRWPGRRTDPSRVRRGGPCRPPTGRPIGRRARRPRSSRGTRPPPSPRWTTCCRRGDAEGAG